MPARVISCGVVVTDGRHLLLGHATRSPRWDIPKGIAEAGEPLIAAAVRELHEETGLQVATSVLHPLGTHAYLRNKDLALFAWRPPAMPDPKRLQCRSFIERPGSPAIPELDRFGVFAFEEALALVGRNLARVLTTIRPMLTG